MVGIYLSNMMDQLNDLQQYADPRTKDWFMLFGNPIPVWILTLTYLIFVTSVGPRFMKNRKPFSLQYFLVVYNISLVILSVYMFMEFMLSTSAAGYNWMCSPYTKDSWKDPRETRVANVMWYYGISKAIELLDTVLMILRKKNNQVTFLHVFHHASMLNIWWWVPTFIPGGQTWFGACLNCLVHIVMYLYYGLSAIPSLRNHLWWKKYITTFQLVQFLITFSHSMQSYLFGCNFPLWGQFLLIGYMVMMLILFGNFYVQSYIKRRTDRQHSKKTDATTNGVASDSHNNSHKRTHIRNGSYTMNGHSNGVTERK